MTAIVLADADDNPITINRVVSLLRGRRFEIVSFTTAKSDRQGTARLTIVIDADRSRAARVVECLAKLADVSNVRELRPGAWLSREMALVRISCSPSEQLASINETLTGAHVIHRDNDSVVLEIAGEPHHVDDILQKLHVRVVEYIRSGTFALSLAPRNTPAH